jgi:hypothetical protein
MPPALSPTLWADAYREAEAAGQLRLVEPEPSRPPRAWLEGFDGTLRPISAAMSSADVGRPVPS